MSLYGYTIDIVGLKCFLIIISPFITGIIIRIFISIIRKLFHSNKSKKIIILSNKLEKEIKKR
jgi:phosphate/sulfate permease